MEIFNNFSDVFANYGWPGIIALIVLGIAIKAIDYLFKKSNKSTSDSISSGFKTMTDTISQQNSQLLKAILDQNEANNEMMSTLINKALDNNHKVLEEEHNKSIQKRIDVSKIIQGKVRDLLNKYNCDRAFIVEFHNSKQNMSGLSFVWFDMLYEEVAKGMPSLHNTYKDQDASGIFPIVTEINENGGYKIFSIDDLEALQKTSSVMYRRLRIERQLQEAIIVGLYNERNMLLGLLVLEYEDSFIPVEVLDMEDILGQATAISTLLDCHS